jgi:hypothetical protein
VGFGRNSSYWNAASFGPDVSVEATIAVNDTALDGDFCLGLRLATIGSGTTTGYLCIFAVGSSNNVDIYRIDAGDGFAAQLTPSVSQTIAATDSIRFQANGSSLTVYRKPSAGSYSLFMTRTDATYSSSGRVGLAVAGTNNDGALDDFGAATIQTPPYINKTIS